MTAFIVLMPFAASGHRMHAALSTLEENPRTRSVEITHRLFIHDVEQALKDLYGPEIDFSENQSINTVLHKYVSQNFAVFLPDGTPLSLQWVGAEIDGDFLWVYQEAPFFSPQESTIHNALLMDFSDAQVNTLNIAIGNITDTLVFTKQTSDLMINRL